MTSATVLFMPIIVPLCEQDDYSLSNGLGIFSKG
jgi:hypothetical protein